MVRPLSRKIVFCFFLSFPSGLLPENLNGVNRQPLKGLKSNRQERLYFTVNRQKCGFD